MTVLMLLMGFNCALFADDWGKPMVGEDTVFEEVSGEIAVEAEHFFQQTQVNQRAWFITSSRNVPATRPDGDPAHVDGASGGAYVEVLPDTRRTHDDTLISGENFSNVPGKLAILHYKVQFHRAGRYYVWARAYSSGSEDNGLHVGLNGQWPESGQRLQWCEGKNGWRWESKQRTQENHCGEPHKIYLDIEKPGLHTIMFSMREDGFEFDKWLMTLERSLERPRNGGPPSRVGSGPLPPAVSTLAAAPASKKFPAHWGEPPPIQTQDYVLLPGGYGNGSSSLAKWIKMKMDRDASDASLASTKPARPLVLPRQADGQGTVRISGELKQWHKVTLSLDGPFAHEKDNQPNPFTDYRLTVRFTHKSGHPSYEVPGYFAADGDAANTSAEAGTQWRAHLSPDRPGHWNFQVSFLKGKNVALDSKLSSTKLVPFDGQTGSFNIGKSDKVGIDFRGKGRLQYVGGHYLQFAGSKEYFLKAGPDSPENLLGYVDFDGTRSLKNPGQAREGEANTARLKAWASHERDWRPGNPTWKNGKGKGLIGALNYLATKGCNSFSFLPYNVGGDGDDVWPFVAPESKLHYDCSKLDQWGMVFDHATVLGLYLHFKLQETEMDDQRIGHKLKKGYVASALDGGDLGVERKLYGRELIARFGHALALNWNLGEENTQSPEQQRAMAQYFYDTDPYKHHLVVHTYPDWQDRVYSELLGEKSALTGASLQNSWSQAHQKTLKWVRLSAEAGKPWVVANDEQNPADMGVPPDPGYQGHNGVAIQGGKPYTLDDVRQLCLWGTLMAGGAGVEYYFGYKLPQNDLACQDWRSRDQSWEYCNIALGFFRNQHIPFWDMKNADALVGNPKNDNSKFCLAKVGEVYLVYLPRGGTTKLDLGPVDKSYSVQWFNPRQGGKLLPGSVQTVRGNQWVSLGNPPADPDRDWVILVTSQ